MIPDANIRAEEIRMWEAVVEIPTPVVRVFGARVETLALQLRAHTGTGRHNQGKKRHMIAHAELTQEQFTSLLAALNEAGRAKGWIK